MAAPAASHQSAPPPPRATPHAAANTSSHPAWKARVAKMMPLLGHRNWILIVDSAYPLQNASGVETIETNAGQLEVLKYVLASIASSKHVRPDLFMDAELPLVPEKVAPGASAYREQVTALLHAHPVELEPHEHLLATIDAEGKQYRVLVLKTTMTIPYSSVFIRLDCKYWSDEDEKVLRAKMRVSQSHF
jgi:hypothetical protein